MLSDLKKARIASGKSIEEISDSLNIRKKYLLALEDCNLESLPSELYARGYFKLYTKYLGIEDSTFDSLNYKDKPQEFTKLINRDSIIVEYKWKKYLILIAILLLVVCFLLYRLYFKE